MLRKLILALGASAAIAAMALSPTAASAKSWNHNHRWFHSGIALYPGYYAAPDCYLVKRVFWSHRECYVRYVQVCD